MTPTLGSTTVKMITTEVITGMAVADDDEDFVSLGHGIGTL